MNEKGQKRIHLTPQMTSDQKRRAVEMALFLGFGSECATFPVTSLDDGIAVCDSMEELQKWHLKRPTEHPEQYSSASDAAKPVPALDWRSKKGLEILFAVGELLKDKNLDLLPDCLDFQIVLKPDADLSVVAAACNLAYRFGMETTAYAGEIVTSHSDAKNQVVFDHEEHSRIWLEERQGGWIIHVCGAGTELEEFTALVCGQFPYLSNGWSFAEFLQEMTDSFAMRNLDGQLTYLKAYGGESKAAVTAYVSPDIEKKRDEAEAYFKGSVFRNYKGKKKVYERQYDIVWEVDMFHQRLKEQLYQALKPGDKVEIYGALSEEASTRAVLGSQIQSELTSRVGEQAQIQIICAYKQGFSWVEEVVLPQLEEQAVHAVEVAFRPFLPEGMTEWLDEDGATPSYNNILAETPDKWYDLPIRCLQELYPVEDMIAERLHVEREQITFTALSDTEDITYRFRAYDESGMELLQSDYMAAYAQRPYLDDYPQMGKVHPSTGYIKAVVNGVVVMDERIATDVEQIWDIYQKEVLPECRDFIEQKAKGKIMAEDQPYFSQLRLEVTASEPDYRLPFREDLISSLNALHEDMYFAGSDYFKNYGIKNGGTMLDAPGLILPVIKKGKGKPFFRVMLYDFEAKEPCIYDGEKMICHAVSREQVELFVKEISYEAGGLCVRIRVDLIPEELAAAYMAMLEEEILDAAGGLSGINSLILETAQSSYRVWLPPHKEIQKDISIADVDISERAVIGYEQYMEIIEQLKRVKSLSVYKTAVSYEGRDIYAIELLPRKKGLHSRTKRIATLPSEIINARHHANEVSGTNAAFMLLKTLLTDPCYEDLPDWMNLVIVPMENVDGTAIHYELQKDNPHWKLHVARFNAVGKEFYHEHFKTGTIHTEAMGLTRLWHRYLPDVIVDNHGVPSHEWEQQFSGYTSPSFKGFWLPRSLLYGYFWYVTDEAYHSNQAVNKRLEDVIADAIGSDPEMHAWNEEWKHRFEKYAHSWMPKLFPADYYKEMINYWIPFAQDSEHRYPSIRFPWITTVAYTSEVADETAQGEYLYLCAKAHVTHDLATINMLKNSTHIFENDFAVKEEHLSVCCSRKRPLIAPAPSDNEAKEVL